MTEPGTLPEGIELAIEARKQLADGLFGKPSAKSYMWVEALASALEGAAQERARTKEIENALERRSRQLHRSERERTRTFVGAHGSWMGRVYDKWEECPSAPCAGDRKLLATRTPTPPEASHD